MIRKVVWCGGVLCCVAVWCGVVWRGEKLEKHMFYFY